MGRYFVIGGKSGNQEGTIRYDQPQELTDEQKKQVWDNIGIDPSAGMKRIIVDTLPETDIDTNAIYMVSRAEAEEQNVYDEYMYIENAWEKIGSTDVDLADYYTKEEADEKFSGYYTKSETDGKFSGYYTKEESDNKYITEHQELKTINGESIVGKGDLEIKGFSGDYNDLINKPVILNHWFGTQSEYDAIVEKDENTIYHIEGGGIDVDDYYTKSEVDGMVNSKANSVDVYTKGEVYTKSDVYNKSEIDEKLDGINNILATI